MRAVIITISFLLLNSCQESECRKGPQIEAQSINIQVDRIEEELFRSGSKEEVLSILEKYPNFSTYFLHADQYPSGEILADKIYNLVKQPSMDTLYQEATQAYEDLSPVITDLEMAFGKLNALTGQNHQPVFQTAVTGLYNDLFISDSLIIVGLDYFIGDDATYKPMDVPEYIMRRYDKAHLSSIIIKFMAGKNIEVGNSETLLSEMIDFGKTYYLASRLAPCTVDSLFLGYTPKEMNLIYANEAIIWANFVENEVLYETSHITKRKFLGERPNVYEISQECPGRVGAWIGWRIVESYMDNNEIDILSLINERDNDMIFRKSGYKPQGN